MKIPKAISLTPQNHAKKQTDPSISLNDMVDNIIRRYNFYKGSSHLIIDKIVSLKNSVGDDGMKEIQEAWAKKSEANKKAKYKIDKYFHRGMKASTNYFSSSPEQSLPAKKTQTEQKENTLDKVTERKSHSDDLSNDSIKEKQLNQSGLSEKKPEFQKILPHHTIEEAIKVKVIFNKISGRSLNLIEAKIKERFNELKSSETPEKFEIEMLNMQEILKKYDNELVCKKIDTIINKYLDEHELYIRENKNLISRVWCAINSVFGLQSITPRKLNEFKMLIVDNFEKEPIENIEKHASDLKQRISDYTHENIAKMVNDFIDIHSIDRINELKSDEKPSVASKTELLEPKGSVATEELLKEVSLKKIVSHIFNRVINNIRRLFSRN
ncbi:hypothetical protein ABN063_13995 [Providencia vermicola]|uniref:hypothetical protein n=1 Tax=Providencia vermicola TaxID=333965 RepID=UPI0032DA92E2